MSWYQLCKSKKLTLKSEFYNSSSKPVALAAVQILDFSNDVFKKNDVYCKVASKIKSKVLDSLDIKMMVCGNVFTCGENGFIHTNDISAADAYNNLSDGLYELRQAQKSLKPISVVLLKEFFPSSFTSSDTLKTAGFKDFKVDVNSLTFSPDGGTLAVACGNVYGLGEMQLLRAATEEEIVLSSKNLQSK